MSLIKFSTSPGIHRLESLTGGTVCGTYHVGELVSIVSMWCPNKSQGDCSRFLDSLPSGILFDNVVSPILGAALQRRGYLNLGFGNWTLPG